jgi:hypothetical protein
MIMTKITGSAIAVAACLLAAPAAFAQVDCDAGLDKLEASANSSMSALGFIHDVAPNEVLFEKAFAGFTYTLDVSLQTLQGDTVDGEFGQVTKVAFDASGARTSTVVQGPVNTLTRLQVVNKDIDALHDAFAITPDILSDRDVVYSGRQQVGNINASVFDILPRNPQANQRSFAGRVWVRTSENAVIRVCGRVGGGPFGPLRYLVTREQVGTQYWLPSVIRADENVRASSGDVHARVTVKYSDYKAR